LLPWRSLHDDLAVGAGNRENLLFYSMPFSMKLWQVQGQDLLEFKRETLNDEQLLENWVVKDPSVLGFDSLLIGRQVRREMGTHRSARSLLIAEL
jgi:hypothetical protein